MRTLVVLSGPICSGKTTLAKHLNLLDGAVIVSARQVLADLGARLDDSERLQRIGSGVEESTGGTWLSSAVVVTCKRFPEASVVVDSARTARQVKLLGQLEGRHIHVH